MFDTLVLYVVAFDPVDGFVPNFMRRFLGEREDQVRVSLRSVEGCGSNGQILQIAHYIYHSIKRLAALA